MQGKLAVCPRRGPSELGSVLLSWATPHSQGPLCMAGSSLIHKGAVRSPGGSRHRNGGGGIRGGNRIQVLTKSLKQEAEHDQPCLPSPGACLCWCLRPAGLLLASAWPRTLLLIPHVGQDTALSALCPLCSQFTAGDSSLSAAQGPMWAGPSRPSARWDFNRMCPFKKVGTTE